MLVLSRKTDEAIRIGEDIKICVLSVKGRQVRLGLEAPRDVAINREEIHNKIKASREKQDTPDTTPTTD